MRFNPDLPYSDLVLLSDLHCGNVFGLWPPDFDLSDGGRHGLNAGQEWLWRCWMHAAGVLAAKANIAAYITNGDLIDGVVARTAYERLTTNRADQANAVRVSLERFMDVAGRAPIFFVQGTEFHDDLGGAEIERIAQVMNAVQYAGVGAGYYSHEVLDLKWRGLNINFSHGIGVSSGLYRATAPDREGIWSALAGREGKLPPAPVVVRSHAHYFVHVEHESKDILITPCWELQTRYMRRHSPYRMLPTIGLVVLRVYEPGQDLGDSRVQVKKLLYGLPAYEAHELNLGAILGQATAVEAGERGAE